MQQEGLTVPVFESKTSWASPDLNDGDVFWASKGIGAASVKYSWCAPSHRHFLQKSFDKRPLSRGLDTHSPRLSNCVARSRKLLHDQLLNQPVRYWIADMETLGTLLLIAVIGFAAMVWRSIRRPHNFPPGFQFSCWFVSLWGHIIAPFLTAFHRKLLLFPRNRLNKLSPSPTSITVVCSRARFSFAVMSMYNITRLSTLYSHNSYDYYFKSISF